MRLLALTGVVLVALVGAGTAQALTEPQSTLLRSLDQTELKALIQDIDAQGLQTSGSTNVKTGVSRMQMASGRLAALKWAGRVGVVGTGSVVVWKIADSLGLGGFVYKKITGETYGGTPPGGTITYRWQCLGAATTNCSSSYSDSIFDPYTEGWYFFRATTLPIASDSSGNGYYCNPSGSAGGTCTGRVDFSATAILMTGTAVGNTASTCSAVGITTAGTCFVKRRTHAQMEASVQIEPSTSAEFASPPAGATTVTGGTNDVTTPTDPELEAALDAIDPNPGTAGTAVEQDTAEAILDELTPGWAVGVLLQPLPNETYAEYLLRLQAAGYVGTATTTVLTTEQQGYGPEAVVRVIATPSGGTTTVYDPLNWPAVSPEISTSSAITIRYNPATAPEAPTTTTPTTVTGAPTTVPSTPAVDFSPITDLDPGCKFPYGFVCYAVDFTEQFDVTADAPVFSFTLGWTGMVNGQEEGGEAPYVVDLEVMDDYMALWRGILTVVLWVGAIYLVATRMLGFKAGGDPGEAIDDVL